MLIFDSEQTKAGSSCGIYIFLFFGMAVKADVIKGFN